VERLLVVVVVAALAVAVAALVQRRRPGVPVETGHHVPAQLHRPDFARPEADWLVVVFTSASCQSCAGVWRKARMLESHTVAVEEVEFPGGRALHDRYGIDGVPTTVVADGEGVVRASFLGPATATDLWATLAELRSPGSVPRSCDHTHQRWTAGSDPGTA
jgi:hypothetical protein